VTAAPSPALDRLHAACDRAGMGRDDPIRLALEVAVSTSDRSAKALDAVLEESGHEIARATAERLGKLAEDHIRRRERARARWLVVAAAVAGVAAGGAALAGGYAWGRSAQRAAAVVTEAGLREAFRDGPDAARAWLELMRTNDVRRALSACRGEAAWTDPATGRKARRMPVWTEPAPPPPDRR
jgi:hypothetical protein